VRETLLFSTRLRTARGHPPDVFKQIRVDIALRLLGLSQVADSPVGDATLRGVSGGEKRRLSVAAEIVAGVVCEREGEGKGRAGREGMSARRPPHPAAEAASQATASF
jgi:hypothetical protein